MKEICIFDVNETLLDMSVLDPEFERVFGQASVRSEWFSQFIQSALVSTITDAYSPFGLIASAALDMMAAKKMVVLADSDKEAILSKLNMLPAYPEVQQGLAILREKGFQTAALSNSTLEVVSSQLKFSGLTPYFDKVLSADQARRLKPSREAYQMAAEAFNVGTIGVRLISTHSWDIAGALRAGCKAAFVERPGMVLDPLVEKPDIIGEGLGDVVNQIISQV